MCMGQDVVCMDQGVVCMNQGVVCMDQGIVCMDQGVVCMDQNSNVDQGVVLWNRMYVVCKGCSACGPGCSVYGQSRV